jgi:RNA polymerase subunit RPABC4/transcription elongation factor Spt4
MAAVAEEFVCAGCGGLIPVERGRCPACGAWRPGARPDNDRPVWEGELLMLPLHGVLVTDRCIVCGSPDGLARWEPALIHLHWRLFWPALLGCLCGPLGASLAFVYATYAMQVNRVTLTRCSSCAHAMILARWTFAFAAFGGIYVLPLAGAWLSRQLGSGPGPGALAGMASWFGLLAAAYLLARRSLVLCGWADDRCVGIRFPSTELTQDVIDGKPI